MGKMSRISRLVLCIVLFLAETFITANPISAKAASIPPTVNFDLIVSGLSNPVFVTNAHDNSHRLFIVQQAGQIRIFKNGSLLSTPFLNISGLVPTFTGVNGEQGLLGLAFDPNYLTNGFFYITYTTTNNDATFPYTTTLARYHVSSGNPDLANTGSGTVLLSIPKKYTNHNGGMISFGPDGYLYMSMGDGGSGGDPDNNAQNLHTMLGKLLRIDVHSTPPAGKKYVIPSTNPFYGSSDQNVKKEIWAYGLRNPWRFSFDRSTGDLYIGDVGQDTEEEIDFQPSSSTGGENYGWHILEGNLCYIPNCVAPSGYVPPVATYDHGTNDSYGCSITGGYVYRGSQFPALKGVYFYGDYCSGKVLGLIKNSNNTWTSNLIVSTNFSISSFGEDEQGEIYVADRSGGKVYQIGYTSIPGKPTLNSPSGSIGTNTPAYIWNEVPGATSYFLWINNSSGLVFKQWYTSVQAACDGNTCSITPTNLNLGGESHTWWIQARNNLGTGPWSNGMTFTPPGLPPPAKTTLISPNGNIGTITPPYTWNEVSGTTWYYLWINNSSGLLFKRWYTSVQANCNGTTCSVIPTGLTLNAGNYTWWIQTWNNNGYGAWSDGMSFSLAIPGRATLISPSGSIGTNTPTYQWNEVSGTTWYFLWINDAASGLVFKRWYTSAQANCNGSKCSVTPAGLTLSSGNYIWWVQTWNDVGYGPWSSGMTFTAP